jgi:hypothetical protein
MAGYFLLMDNVRRLAEDLGLWVGPGNTMFENAHLQAVFNDWLYSNGLHHIMAASVQVVWPRTSDDFGIMFISRIGGTEEESLIEDAKVKEEIKAWSPKLNLQLQWASLTDQFGITERGIRPRPDKSIVILKSLEELDPTGTWKPPVEPSG